MASYIRDTLNTLNIQITNHEIQHIAKLVSDFELRSSSHTLALNSQLLGIHPISFKDSDRNALFDLFNIREDIFRKTVLSINSIAKKDTKSNVLIINPKHKVASDPFNLLCIYIAHLSYKYITNIKIRDDFLKNIFMYLHYRFFTSMVNHSFPHLANESIMAATINDLTRKYDIVIYGTWKRVIEERCKDIFNEKSIHHKYLMLGSPDERFIYILTDVQTRMRDRVKNIINMYYKKRESGGSIKSVEATTKNIDGEKILVTKIAALDVAVTSVASDVLNVKTFIEPQLKRSIVKQFSTISTNSFDNLLQNVSSLASIQHTTNTLDIPIINMEDGTRTVGIRLLIKDIIHSSYRYCITNNIQLTNAGDAYLKIKNIFSASRISDAYINDVKDRVVILIDSASNTPRPATKASLRIAFICYIVSKSLKYIT